MEDKDKLYSTQEAATMLGISDSRIRQMIMRGEFTPKRQIGRVWVFSPEEIEQLRHRNKSKGGRPKKQ